MRIAWKQILIMSSMVLAFSRPLIGFAQPEFTGPVIVRMVGVVQSFDEKKSHELNTLTLTFEEKKWLFQVSRVDVQSGIDPGTSLLDSIFPPELRLMGESTILAPLEESTSVGKTITLEGALSVGERNYNVTSVSIAEGTPQ